MDLLLVRCADLETDGRLMGGALTADDEAAPPGVAELRDPINAGLSERGERHSRRLAAWLRNHRPSELQLFSSPAKGARQMAGILAEGMAENHPSPIVSRLLGPTALASDILGAVGWPHDYRAALVVAHQPALGALASLLLTGHQAPMAFKKGAIWWFSNRNRGGEMQTVLRCALTPDLLKGGGRSARASNEAVDPPGSFRVDIPDVADMLRFRLAGKFR